MPSERFGVFSEGNPPKRTFHSRGVFETMEEFNPRHAPEEPTMPLQTTPTYLLVTVPPMATYSREAIRQYVKDAVTSWAGQFSPDDEMFEVQDEISVQFTRKEKKE